MTDPEIPTYVDLQTVKLAVLGVDGASDTSRDPLFLVAIEAAARQIDNTCERVFYRDDVASPRVYPVAGREYYDRRAGSYTLLVDDFASNVGLVVEVGRGASWTALTTNDYTPVSSYPLDRGRPFSGLVRYQSWGRLDVRLTAPWGYPSIPREVKLANQLQGARLFKRKDSPEGVTASGEWGAIRVARVDHDVAALIKDHVREGVA